jgi:glycogen(starch) synthase
MPERAAGFVRAACNPEDGPTSKRVSSPKTRPPRPAPGLLREAGAGSLPPPRVLSFGWELAPILSGGLGVACAGLGRALAEQGVELTFVLPKMPRPISPRGIRVVNAKEVAASGEGSASDAALPGKATVPDAPFHDVISFETPLTPYQDAAAYRESLRSAPGRRDGAERRRQTCSPAGSRVSDGASVSLYGGDLLAEVRRMASAASRIAADVAHDVIHCHDWMTFAAGMAAREVSGRPLVVHVHSTESDRSGGGWGNAAIRSFERAGILAADRVVAVSDFTRRKILEQYPDVDEARLRVVHNGIEPLDRREAAVAVPPLASRRPIVLFLGRLTAQKGPEWFLRAAALVHRVRPEALFVVAGTGEMLPWMVERAAELGLAANFLFTGFLAGDDIARAYAMADVFVMPSVSEPFGLVPVEAMLRGTPAIVSRQSGVVEAIRHCLKVDFWDTEDLADKIVGVLDHPSLAASLGEAGEREASRMGWEGPAAKLLRVFAELAAASTPDSDARSIP